MFNQTHALLKQQQDIAMQEYLDVLIDKCPHVGPARVCQDRPAAECSLAEFRFPLKPCDDVALVQSSHWRVDDIE